jgi:Na+/H+-translocating membrane pyrophosphatase
LQRLIKNDKIHKRGGDWMDIMLAIFMANNSETCDHKIKHHGGENNETLKVFVIEDTVGYFFKKTNGAAVDFMNNLMTTISLLTTKLFRKGFIEKCQSSM